MANSTYWAFGVQIWHWNAHVQPTGMWPPMALHGSLQKKWYFRDATRSISTRHTRHDFLYTDMEEDL